MVIKHKFIKNTLKRGCKSYFKKDTKITAYEEQDGACIYSCNFLMSLEQRYLTNLCFYYIPKDKKLFLVAFTDALNDKIDYKIIVNTFNESKQKGDILAGVTKYRKLWNLSPYLVNTFGELNSSDNENTLCVYQEINKVGVLSLRRNIRKFRKTLDLYKTSKSKKIRSLYNQLGTLVLHYNNGHE